MCGRFARFSPAHIFRALFQFEEFIELPPQYNIAPGQTIYAVRGIIVQEKEGKTKAQPQAIKKELAPLQWGFIPSWAKELTNRVINARAETIIKKASFKTAFSNRRCLIPVDGFYEWQKSRNDTRQPFFVRMLKGKPFALGGIWDVWKSPTGKQIESCAIITTPPNELLKQIHNRMPAIIEPHLFDIWLNPSPENLENALAMLKPFEATEMEIYPVDNLVNNPKNEGEQCIRPKKEKFKQQKLPF